MYQPCPWCDDNPCPVCDKLPDPRLRTHSNQSRWDQLGYVVEALRKEGYNDTQVARLLHVTQRTVKSRRGRVAQ